MARWLIGLMVSIAAFSAHAGILYKWEATCTDRYFLDEDGNKLQLSCERPIRGTLLMPAGYIPGTFYDYPDQSLPVPVLKIFDTRFGTIRIDQGFEPSAVEAELPVESGPGFTGWAWPAGHIALPGQTAFEIGVPSSYVIVTTDAFFARVPEPGTLVLMSFALGIVALRRPTGHR